MNYCWIDTQTTFDKAMDELSAGTALALDTEFYRRASFFSVPCLLQITDDKNTYLIDLLAELVLTKLGEILANERIVKILHAAAEDIELLYRLTQVKPVNVFDTQIAAAFLGMGRQLGYAALVQSVFPAVVLDKTHSTFDWRIRCLPESCARYAALDVAYLLALYVHTFERLERMNRLTWVHEECNASVEATIRAITHNSAGQYLHFHHCAYMTHAQQHALDVLLTWREMRARHTNSVRKSILSEEQIIDIASMYGSSRNRSLLLALLTDSQQTQHGHALWDVWCQLHDTRVPKFVPILAKKPHLSLLQKLSKKRTAIAETHDIEPCLLAVHKQMTHLIYYQHYKHTELAYQLPRPAVLCGWRKDLVGRKLAALCPNQ